jgi:hypothetical protein
VGYWARLDPQAAPRLRPSLEPAPRADVSCQIPRSAREKFFAIMPRLQLPILAALCLASLAMVLPRGGDGLSALPLLPGGAARAGSTRNLVPTADWFEQIFRNLRGNAWQREDGGNREREDWERGSDRRRNRFDDSDRRLNRFDDEEQEGRRSAGGYFRTMCVRLCDGFPIPMSFSTTRSQFTKDARRCAQACPAGRLFVYRNPGGDIDDMVDLEGHAYRQLPTAFLHQSTYVENCTCHGNPWDPAAIARHQSYAAQGAQATAGAAQAKDKPATNAARTTANPERWVQNHGEADGERR